ncbi:MAG: efflux RND transporter periplasmic adaptor subunit [Chloroflexota bacterium]|nr:efflux RND transporter periplasmic adaptor subunit [Chloroflexota bacterium]
MIAMLSAIGFYYWMATKSAPNVTLYQVSTQNMTQDIGGGGYIYPRHQLIISYPIAERVIAVLVKPGDQVSPNQPLIQLDPSQLNAQINQASNDVTAAQAYLNSVTSSGNSLVIAQAQQAYNIAKNKYNSLVAEASSPTLHNGTLISPMNGIVTNVNINPGEVFRADTPLLTIMDEATVIVRVKIPLSNYGQVHVGQSTIVTPSTLPTLNFKGSVDAIIPRADPQTDTFEIWVGVANTDQQLLPGMSAFVRVQSAAHAFVVPRLAVLNLGSESIVFIVHNLQAFMDNVRVIGRSGDAVLVGSGLSIGDQIVLVGLDVLQNGEHIQVTRVESYT